ncbi:PEP-CTERM protein-sorting domain-containing protein [Duganella sacchari]|uniref:PEP-CTERM protein-sorting domain-containing protein n=1 Tax=Duganella sacchari TaxID=551987 RepID=A0A1M7MVI1_9BURK|nr:NF038122 family metalloprotease [Duganella sacchari]SHM95031.1 PEP-CTERM protein-sorting domain-containing protein [Duganella sacchari]
MKQFIQRPLLAGALGLAFLTPAQAVTFVLNDVSTGGMSAQQLAGFQAAANFWSGKLTDNVTVYLDIGFNNLGQNILGSTSSNFVTTSYSNVRTALQLDATSSLDHTAVSHLQSGSALTFMATQGDGSSRLDNDGSVNNLYLGMTTANAKAMGFAVGTSTATPDASIVFANAYAGDFSYSRVGGTPGNKVDFITVAEHEIGHALGFTSGVDDIDYCMAPRSGSACGISNTASRFENDWWYEPLDLYRYSAPGVADVRVGGTPYFSVDGGITSIAAFSTGTEHGDGWQASHFGPNQVNLMRPFVGNGQSYDASSRDLAAMDAIGWDLAAPVPEPQTWAMLLAGLGLVGWMRRRSA